MNILLTGAFGNVGSSALHELLKQGYTVRCFDLETPANRRAARRIVKTHGQRVEVAWGDLRKPEDVASAVRGQEIVVHLAFIIPKLSATGVDSESRPDWAREINVGGTRNLLEAMKAQPKPPRILFASSYHIYGRTQDQPPPRTVWDPAQPTEHYSRHKVECERLVRTSGLEWCIFRLCAALPLSLRPDPGMFDVPLDNRIEFVHTRDVGLAIANGMSNAAIWRKVLLIGGGPRCQYVFREIAGRSLDALGVGMLPGTAFSQAPFPTDWVDSADSEALLHYQRRDLGDYLAEMSALLGYRRVAVRLFRPIVRRWLLKQSPYHLQAQRGLAAQPGAGVALAETDSPPALVLTPEVRSLLIETAKDLRGQAQLLFIARTVQTLGRDGQAIAERELGWARAKITVALAEMERHKQPATQSA